MSLHESEPKGILPFPEPKSDPATLRSIGAVVDATFAYKSDVEGHIKEHGSEAAGLTFRDALTRVTRAMTTPELESATRIRDLRTMPHTSHTIAPSSGEYDTVSEAIAARRSSMTLFERYAVATFPERFGIIPSVTMEQNRGYDVDGSPMNLPANTAVVPGDLPRRFRR